MNQSLIFTVALNGYQWRYRSLIKTQQAYAQRFGHHYLAITQPWASNLGLEVAWLKVRVIVEALRLGYQQVMFLDADTRVAPDAPDIMELLHSSYSIFAARGYSGRFNSGVLLVKNDAQARHFFKQLLSSATMPIPKEDEVGWGENGHFIHLAKHSDIVGELSPVWNNNQYPGLKDYVRHYSRGPLHNEFSPSLVEGISAQCAHYVLAIGRRLNLLSFLGKASPRSFRTQLEMLAHRVFSKYPILRRTVSSN